LVSFIVAYHPSLSVSAQRACHYSLYHDTSLLHLVTFQASNFFNDHEREMSNPHKAVPLVAPGHTRPITHLSFSPLLDDGTYLLISSCKDGNPMLREWTGDWIGTFVGHKGAVWCTKLSQEGSRAASGSADFTACVSLSYFAYVQIVCSPTYVQTLPLLQ
jgi:WD40 repeat protein